MHKHRSSVIVGTQSNVNERGNFFAGQPTSNTVAATTLHSALHTSNSSAVATGNLLQGGNTGMANAPKKSNLGTALT
jgi:hypothetical protein